MNHDVPVRHCKDILVFPIEGTDILFVYRDADLAVGHVGNLYDDFFSCARRFRTFYKFFSLSATCSVIVC